MGISALSPHSWDNPETLGLVWKSTWLSLSPACSMNLGRVCSPRQGVLPPWPSPGRPVPPRGVSPGDLLLQGSGVRGVELHAEAHGEGRLGCSDNSDTAVTERQGLSPSPSRTAPLEEAARYCWGCRLPSPLPQTHPDTPGKEGADGQGAVPRCGGHGESRGPQ